MKFIIAILCLIAPDISIAKCRIINPEDGKKDDTTETFMGGCKYVSPVLKVGYSNEYHEFIGIGTILPFDQFFNWEGSFIESGASLVVSKYEGSEIFDIGFSKRAGIDFVTTGFDVGLSYRESDDEMRGVYAGFNLFGMVLVRYLENDEENQVSVELGFKL